jgi:hypothetical protein
MGTKKENFEKEHAKIVDNHDGAFVVTTEWRKEGDYFKKLSVYDDSYILIYPLNGGTTLLNY